jgi:hypothetical protein
LHFRDATPEAAAGAHPAEATPPVAIITSQISMQGFVLLHLWEILRQDAGAAPEYLGAQRIRVGHHRGECRAIRTPSAATGPGRSANVRYGGRQVSKFGLRHGAVEVSMAREDQSTEHAGMIPDVDEPGVDETPSGAIAITLFLAATIIVVWFGMFVLNLVRG